MGVRTDDETEGQPGVSELRCGPACLVPGTRTTASQMRTDLAAAIAEIRELYERESAGLVEQVGAPAREPDSPRQQADNAAPEIESKRTEVEGAEARAARAVAALAAEHETRLAVEVELHRLREEVEGERERTREAVQQAQVSAEQWQRAEAEVVQLRREIWERHHYAEQEHARLVEEANGLEERFAASELEAEQLRQAEVAGGLFGRWPRLSATSLAVLGIGVGVLATWLRDSFPEPGPQPPAVSAGAEQPRTFAATPNAPQAAPDFTADQGRGDNFQSGSQTAGHPQRPVLTTPIQSKVLEEKFAPQTAVPADALRRKDAAQENAPAKVEPQQLEAPPKVENMALSLESITPPVSSLSTTSTSLTKEITSKRNILTDAVAVHISIHYRQGSSSAHSTAERVATWIASSGFGASQLLRTQRAQQEQVVRYFFTEDAEAAGRIVGQLLKRGGRWRAEDRTHDRHKPPAGSIQVWPSQVP